MNTQICSFPSKTEYNHIKLNYFGKKLLQAVGKLWKLKTSCPDGDRNFNFTIDKNTRNCDKVRNKFLL